MIRIYCLNGPNLNLLGRREPHIYGHARLEEIEDRLGGLCRDAGARLVFRQTNSEGELVDWVQEAAAKADALLLNAAAYTHTSVALHDALKALDIPICEIHLSNPAARESFRHRNYVSALATVVVAGLGPSGYDIGLQAALDRCRGAQCDGKR